MAKANIPDQGHYVPNDIFRHVIRRQKSYLIERLGYNVEKILDKLGEIEIITDDTLIRNIQDTIKNKTRSEGVRMILDEVISQSDRNYRALLDILEEVGIDTNVKITLQEEENNIQTEGIVVEMEKMTISVQPPGSHYDICIIFEDTNKDVGEALKNYLQDLDSDVKVLMFDDQAEFETASKTDKLVKIYQKSSMQLYIVPEFRSEDEYVTWINDSLIMQCVDDDKFTIRKVLQDKQKIKNIKLANIQDVKWYDRHKRNFRDSMKKLIDSLKAKRHEVEKQEIRKTRFEC